MDFGVHGSLIKGNTVSSSMIFMAPLNIVLKELNLKIFDQQDKNLKIQNRQAEPKAIASNNIWIQLYVVGELTQIQM